MTLRESLTILTKMQKWRRGLLRDMPYTPKEFGQAIDVGIEAIEHWLESSNVKT